MPSSCRPRPFTSCLASPDLGARGRVGSKTALVDVDLSAVSSSPFKSPMIQYSGSNQPKTHHDTGVVLRSVGRDRGQEFAAGRRAAGALDRELGALGVELRGLRHVMSVMIIPYY